MQFNYHISVENVIFKLTKQHSLDLNTVKLIIYEGKKPSFNVTKKWLLFLLC